MKVNELVLKLWYSADILIIKADNAFHLRLDDFKNEALFKGCATNLRSVLNKHFNEMEVVNYGVWDGYFVIEVK